MDIKNRNLYNANNSNKGVIHLVPVTAPVKQATKKSHSTSTSAMSIRKKRGVRTLTGKRLVELFKDGQ